MSAREKATEKTGASHLSRPEKGSAIRRAVIWTLEAGAILLMTALAVLVLANALGRYLFAAPLPWTEEVVLNLLVWLAAVGVVLGSLNRTLICCEMISMRVTGGSGRALILFIAVSGAGVMLYFSWLTWRYLLLFGSDLSPILNIPKAVVILGFFFATLGLSATLLIPVLKR